MSSDQFFDLGYEGKKKIVFGECELCKGKGSILAFLKDDLTPYAFKCSCPMGEKCKKNFPLWPGFEAGYVVAR